MYSKKFVDPSPIRELVEELSQLTNLNLLCNAGLNQRSVQANQIQRDRRMLGRGGHQGKYWTRIGRLGQDWTPVDQLEVARIWTEPG